MSKTKKTFQVTDEFYDTISLNLVPKIQQNLTFD